MYPLVTNRYRIALVGATGVVGQTVLKVLEERDFPVHELVPFASPKSAGKSVTFRGAEIPCQVLTEDNIDGFDIVFSSAGGTISEEWAPRFAARGAIVIDKSSFWRMLMPLVVPEVNPEDIYQAISGERIISSPNCSTMQMVVALAPIHREAGIEEIIVSTYQSVSGTGRAAIAELETQTDAVIHGQPVPESEVYPHQIAFNVIPQVETFELEDETGFTTEERKMMDETRRIMGLSEDQLRITATCARVPVLNCHSESIRIRTRAPLSLGRCRSILSDAPGVVLVDDPRTNSYPMGVDATGRDDVLVGRLRHDLGPGGEHYLNMWVVGDNLRKGAATNAVQIAELLHSRGLASATQRAELRHPIAV